MNDSLPSSMPLSFPPPLSLPTSLKSTNIYIKEWHLFLVSQILEMQKTLQTNMVLGMETQRLIG